MPAGFSGALEVIITLPSGSSWPSNGNVSTIAYVGTDSADDKLNLLQYADPKVHNIVDMDLVGLNASTGRLVEVGNNTVLFQVPSN